MLSTAGWRDQYKSGDCCVVYFRQGFCAVQCSEYRNEGIAKRPNSALDYPGAAHLSVAYTKRRGRHNPKRRAPVQRWGARAYTRHTRG